MPVDYSYAIQRHLWTFTLAPWKTCLSVSLCRLAKSELDLAHLGTGFVLAHCAIINPYKVIMLFIHLFTNAPQTVSPQCHFTRIDKGRLAVDAGAAASSIHWRRWRRRRRSTSSCRTTSGGGDHGTSTGLVAGWCRIGTAPSARGRSCRWTSERDKARSNDESNKKHGKTYKNHLITPICCFTQTVLCWIWERLRRISLE